MRKKEWFVLIACIFCIACSALFSFGEECSFIRENTLRLHILANSDSPADQALKLKIRDAVLSCSGELFSGCDTRQKMISAAQEQLPKIQQVAEQTALHNGYELPVTVSVTDMFFETRRYDHVILPAGTYTAVRIELGAAAGKNWWCVLYPPLCVSAAQTGFTEEEAQISDSLLQQDALPRYRARLAVVEWWETLCRWAKEKGAD
ncbi:MAG: stage II sporulation protein R [Oscillospiraceae bacterium]|nr:stage II sporulation protein R [Oscillospiraceae bacterium]MDD7041110.1 stage II sporulation protein R [Oscillospiraceae bacterium]MDY2611215.1 stage II sporulation protein R [Oscillospiraceae bacterium]